MRVCVFIQSVSGMGRDGSGREQWDKKEGTKGIGWDAESKKGVGGERESETWSESERGVLHVIQAVNQTYLRACVFVNQ